MDIATVVGFVSSVTLVIMAAADPIAFFDVPSIIVVVGGIIGLMLFSFPLHNVSSLFRYFGYTVYKDEVIRSGDRMGRLFARPYYHAPTRWSRFQ